MTPHDALFLIRVRLCSGEEQESVELSSAQRSGKDLMIDARTFVLPRSTEVLGLRAGTYEARLAAAPAEAFNSSADPEAVWQYAGSYAVATFILNAPPVLGTLSIDPMSGQAGKTLFSLEATDFADDGDGLPLAYGFW